MLRLCSAPLTALAAVLVLVSATFAGAGPRSGAAGLITVDTATDNVAVDGACSLREAIVNANDGATHSDCAGGAAGADVIEFDGVVGPIVLAEGSLPAITDDLSILGSAGTRIDGAGAYRVLEVETDTLVELRGLVIENALNETEWPGDCYGGAILNRGDLRLVRVTLRRNETSCGGSGLVNYGRAWLVATTVVDNFSFFGGAGLFNFGQLLIDRSAVVNNTTSLFNGAGLWNGGGASAVVENSTFSGNVGFDNDMGDENAGGAIYNDGTLAVVSSTIVANGGEDGGGGIASPFGTSTVSGSIVAGNRSRQPPATEDCYGDVVSLGYNVFGDGTGCAADGPGRSGDRPGYGVLRPRRLPRLQWWPDADPRAARRQPGDRRR